MKLRDKWLDEKTHTLWAGWVKGIKDKELVPGCNEINALRDNLGRVFVVTVSSCIGHMGYAPRTHEGISGYIGFHMTRKAHYALKRKLDALTAKHKYLFAWGEDSWCPAEGFMRKYLFVRWYPRYWREGMNAVLLTLEELRDEMG